MNAKQETIGKLRGCSICGKKIKSFNVSGLCRPHGAGRRTTHGMTGTREYRAWCGIKERCDQKGNKSYPFYGGRGIKYCDSWKSFENFLADMGPMPSDCNSLDRINGEGNYEPGNCRWANPKIQGMNRKGVRIYKGKSIADWEKELGFCKGAIRARLRKGWSLEKAINIPKLQIIKTS